MKEELVNTASSAIEILAAENEKGREYVAQLRSTAQRIQTDGFSFEAFEQIVRTLRLIETERRRHCENVERFLLPLLHRHTKGLLPETIQECRDLWKALSALKECVKDIEDLKIHHDIIRDLTHYSNTIVELMSRHIEKENTVLFPLAQTMLTTEETDQLRASILFARPSETLQ